MGQTVYTYNKDLNGKLRPAKYGVVTICYEVFNPGLTTEWTRPVVASGIIYPQSSTAGRKSAPEPKSNFRVGMTERVPKKNTNVGARNRGAHDLDKGHIIALELGGPDEPGNICPQFSQLQRNGEWRKMETTAYDLATEAEGRGELITITIAINYGTAMTFKRALVPSFFDVKVERAGDNKLVQGWRIVNEQDVTDDKMFLRESIKLDPLAEGEPMALPRPPLRPNLHASGAPTALAEARRGENWFAFATRYQYDSEDYDPANHSDMDEVSSDEDDLMEVN